MVRLRGTSRGDIVSGERLVRWPRRLLLLALLNAAAGVSGCGSDGLTPGKDVPLTDLYWMLGVNHRAVTLAPPAQAPYDTLTLVATPRTIDDSVLSGLPAATFVSTDPEKVAVTSDGVLQALAPTDGVVKVLVTLTAGNLKHADTVQVKVLELDPRPVLTTFSVRPTPPDSAKVGISYINNLEGENGTSTCFALPTWTRTPNQCAILLPVRVLDAAGVPIPGVPVAFRSSDERVARVDNRETPILYSGLVQVGHNLPDKEAIFVATTTVFGVAKADTFPFRSGWPVLWPVQLSQNGFDPPLVKIGVGGVVIWIGEEGSSSTVDVTFTDPTNVADAGPLDFFTPFQRFVICQLQTGCADAGNIVMTPPTDASFGGRRALRRFTVPGVYDYSSTALGGASGRIIVVDERP